MSDLTDVTSQPKTWKTIILWKLSHTQNHIHTYGIRIFCRFWTVEFTTKLLKFSETAHKKWSPGSKRIRMCRLLYNYIAPDPGCALSWRTTKAFFHSFPPQDSGARLDQVDQCMSGCDWKTVIRETLAGFFQGAIVQELMKGCVIEEKVPRWLNGWRQIITELHEPRRDLLPDSGLEGVRLWKYLCICSAPYCVVLPISVVIVHHVAIPPPATAKSHEIAFLRWLMIITVM